VLTAAEAICFALWRRDLLVTLASGACLLLALRAALAGAGWELIALCLLAAGVAHAVDLKQRTKNE